MSTPQIIGHSALFLETLDLVSTAAQLHRPVVIAGERGTGKELIADRLHYLSPRWDQPFLKINCAALPETLLESELFGHEAGSFTGADRRHTGRFERAGAGTIFLDEIASMSMRLQEKLLRVIEYGAFERVGGSKTMHSLARVVSAANRDLPTLARQGHFRPDLLDRLAFDVITLPPLRKRREDIPLLADHFALNMTKEMRRPFFPGFSEQVAEKMMNHHWPGNVRQLKSVVERAVYHARESEIIDNITLDPFVSPFRLQEDSTALPETAPTPKRPTEQVTPSDFRKYIQTTEKQLIRQALRENRFNQRRTAEALNLTYHQLRGYLKKYDINTGKKSSK